MIRTKFEINHKEYIVWGEFGETDDGQPMWLCREYYGDGSTYLTTAEINAALATPFRPKVRIFEDDVPW